MAVETIAAEKATAALLRVTWELAKKRKPFVDAEVAKVVCRRRKMTSSTV